ncbi:MAG: glycosyltransferase [Anaerolineae bacterium]|nr:glycosyltransferase [Anaerolineae bacterium]
MKAELWAYAARARGARRPVVVRGELPAVVLNPHAPTIDMERALMQHADAILPVSHTVADLIAAHYNRVADEVIYNAVDLTIFKPAPRPHARPGAGARRVLWVGSHAPIKRLDMLDEIIQRTATHITFDIVIPWAEGNAHIAQFAAYPRVTLHHHVTQARMAELYNAADVLLSTSRLEAFGLGILEAMACGTPVLIPRDIGGAAEFVRQDRDGHYYDSVAEAVARLETEDWGRFGDAMVQQARSFSWVRSAEQTLAAYARVLARTGG